MFMLINIFKLYYVEIPPFVFHCYYFILFIVCENRTQQLQPMVQELRQFLSNTDNHNRWDIHCLL